MLSVVGASLMVWPVGEVTTTARIEPSLPVITWLTVPTVTPVEFWTVRPVVRPGSAVLATAPRPSTLLLLEWLMPFGDACCRLWLLVARVFVVVVLSCRTLFGLD